MKSKIKAKPEMNKNDELVLGAPVESINAAMSAVGFGGLYGGVTASPDAVDSILGRAEFEFRRRGDCETDPTFKQLIPYIMIRHPGTDMYYPQVLTYSRGGAEQRLHGTLSIGYGGHINPVDVLDVGFVTGMTLQLAAMRELSEELRLPRFGNPHVLGLVNNEADAVGRVHLGVVMSVTVFDRTAVKDLEANRYVEWHDIDDLMRLHCEQKRLEAWSGMLVECKDLSKFWKPFR